MKKENVLEIYRQRYETFRHLDKLRWQLVQLSVAIFTATALVLRVSSGDVEWWFTLALGMALIGISFSMLKISAGLRKNQIILKQAASVIGDEGIPDISKSSRSVFLWISLAIGGVGVVFLIKAYLALCGV